MAIRDIESSEAQERKGTGSEGNEMEEKGREGEEKGGEEKGRGRTGAGECWRPARVSPECSSHDPPPNDIGLIMVSPNSKRPPALEGSAVVSSF